MLQMLTFSGPVLSSVHSEAEELIWSRGSSHDTAKYMEMDMVWSLSLMLLISSITNLKE